MKLNRLFLFIALAVFTVGCYEEHTMVGPRKVYDDQSYEEKFPAALRISIAELKYAFGEISNTGVNSGWSNTIYKLIGDDIFPNEDVYIKGKVISDDEEGNVYKSLFIQDETSGIEIKLNNNVGVRYKKGTWVYVRLKGLYLGNYRMMLSLGAEPSESWNKAGEHKYYANSNIELQEIIDKHVFPGGPVEGGLKVGTYEQWKSDPTSVDIITVTLENYEEVFSPEIIKLEGKVWGDKRDENWGSLSGDNTKRFEIKQREIMFGRLMRFEGLQCHYAGVKNQNGETRPGLKSGSFENIYPSWLYTDVRPTVSKPWYHWAYKDDKGRSLYGSVLFTYNPDATVCSENGVYALRTSGYSRFVRRNVCKDGEKATIIAIYGIYAQRSDYAGNANDYASYQLTISSFSDIEFENGEDALLSDEQVAELTTEDMAIVPWIDEEGESEIQ
ncbi:MAG: hypothetical protein IKY74_00945 [Alistipes sp.]|nr:hypothetical protein [Alistipes sp.]